jgi:hypothetical protein
MELGKKKDMPAQQSFDNAKIYVWVKGLETKVNNLLREVDILKNDFTKKHNEFKGNMKMLMADLTEVKREQSKAGETTDLIVKELKRTAGSEELMTLKKYIDFWNPMNFVTQRDLERLVDAKLANVKSNTKKVK